MRVTVFRQPVFWTTAAAVALLSVGHYAAPVNEPFWHDLFRRLYYLPIILAAFRYGLAGGIIAAAAVTLAFLPHVAMTAHSLHVQVLEARFEVPLYFAVGAITGLLSDRQRRASDALRRAERLQTLGTMAAGLAHEVRNPLAAIRSSAEMLGAATDGRGSELAGIVVTEADRLNRLVTDFLQYARPASPRRSPVLASSLLDACLALVRPQLVARHAVVATSFPAGEREIAADPDQLRQVFLNLLLNALQAIPEGGRIAVSVEQDRGETRIVISDNGPGIPGDRLARVCEPFYSTREGGTGLGLAVARRIVTEHGGRLEITSPDRGGVRATVLLPEGNR